MADRATFTFDVPLDDEGAVAVAETFDPGEATRRWGVSAGDLARVSEAALEGEGTVTLHVGERVQVEPIQQPSGADTLPFDARKLLLALDALDGDDLTLSADPWGPVALSDGRTTVVVSPLLVEDASEDDTADDEDPLAGSEATLDRLVTFLDRCGLDVSDLDGPYTDVSGDARTVIAESVFDWADADDPLRASDPLLLHDLLLVSAIGVGLDWKRPMASAVRSFAEAVSWYGYDLSVTTLDGDTLERGTMAGDHPCAVRIRLADDGDAVADVPFRLPPATHHPPTWNHHALAAVLDDRVLAPARLSVVELVGYEGDHTHWAVFDSDRLTDLEVDYGEGLPVLDHPVCRRGHFREVAAEYADFDAAVDHESVCGQPEPDDTYRIGRRTDE